MEALTFYRGGCEFQVFLRMGVSGNAGWQSCSEFSAVQVLFVLFLFLPISPLSVVISGITPLLQTAHCMPPHVDPQGRCFSVLIRLDSRGSRRWPLWGSQKWQGELRPLPCLVFGYQMRRSRPFVAGEPGSFPDEV